jgi:hypothetical protein
VAGDVADTWCHRQEIHASPSSLVLVLAVTFRCNFFVSHSAYASSTPVHKVQINVIWKEGTKKNLRTHQRKQWHMAD